jgi:hypothetical protein
VIKVTVRGGEVYSHPGKDTRWSVDGGNPMLLHVFTPRKVLLGVAGGNPAAAQDPGVELAATYIVPNVIRIEKEDEG